METDIHNDDQINFIIGGGCLAASTAFAVKREWPDSRVAWYAGTHKHTASNDFLKIIRDVYPEDKIAELANRAMQEWKNTAPYSEFFHQTAWIQAIDKDTKKTMNKGQNDKIVTVAEMMHLVGSTVEPRLDAGEELYLNPNVGYADSALALQAITDIAVKLGVKRYDQNVTKLVIESGRCLGVEVGGTIVKAEETIVSAGA
jgi:glycine/D-amino acid oxidase-like deaminating enzyme